MDKKIEAQSGKVWNVRGVGVGEKSAVGVA